MKLPGGLLVDGQLCCDFGFKKITGSIEREILESSDKTDSLVSQVTDILNITLAHIAGMPVSTKLVCSLCSGDRQYLILQLQAIINPANSWLTARCGDCNELIQLQLIPGALPVMPAGKNFPATTAQLSIGEVSLRVPNGADEAALQLQPNDEKKRLNHLLKRLLSQADKTVNLNSLNKKDLDIIDQTLEAMMPQASTVISTNCPYCDSLQEINHDIYAWMSEASHDIENDIHQLAINYHWSEKEILALPKTRRQHYIQLIEQDRYQMYEEGV